MRGLGRLDRDEGDQRYPDGFAGKYDVLHAKLQRRRRHVRTSEYNGNGEYRWSCGQRYMRIGERHDSFDCAFGQPLLSWYIVVCGRLGSVDMELRRFQRRHLRDLHGFALCVDTDTGTDINADTRSCRRKLRHAVGQYRYLL